MKKTDYRKENIKVLKEQYDKLYIFGAGRWCRYFLFYIGDIAVEIIDRILVSDLKDNPLDIAGIAVGRINEVPITDDDAIIVAIYENEKVIQSLDKYKNVIPFQNVIPVLDPYQNTYLAKREQEVKRYIGYFEQEPQLFKYVEIETINRCNGECSFCPVNRNEKQRVYHKMSVSMFEDIIGQLSEIRYRGLLGLFSNNEAFLDERIGRFAKYAREMLPHAYIYIISNGKLITLDKFKDTIPYLDLLQVDDYEMGGEKPENIIQIEQEVKKQGIHDKYRYYEIDKDAVRTSRGGNAPNRRIYYTMDVLCPLPFVQMVIRPDGAVSLCCNDALGENTLGDLRTETLLDIWNSERYKRVRKAAKTGRYSISTCRYCNTVDGRELWKTGIYE